MTKTDEVTMDRVTFDVEYYYDEGEPMVWRDSDGGGFPGVAPTVEIQEITISGSGDLKDLLNSVTLEEIKEKLLDLNE
jgi:hypothetical protein